MTSTNDFALENRGNSLEYKILPPTVSPTGNITSIPESANYQTPFAVVRFNKSTWINEPACASSNFSLISSAIFKKLYNNLVSAFGVVLYPYLMAENVDF